MMDNHFPSLASLQEWAGVNLVKVYPCTNKKNIVVAMIYEVIKDKQFHYFKATKGNGFDLIATSYQDVFAEDKNGNA